MNSAIQSAKNAYALAGVDVSIEAKASRILYEASRKTFNNRKGLIGEIDVPFDDFAGLKDIDVSGLPPGSRMSMNFDGAGSKVEPIQRWGSYKTVGFDLLAMLCDDAVVRNAEPVLVGSVLDIKTLGTDDRFLPLIAEIAEGYVAAAEAAGVAIINGEIAQMGALVSGYGEFPFNWSGACVWFGKKGRLLRGTEPKIGDAIVMLRQKEGFRANGFSLVRKVFEREYGSQWHEAPFHGQTLGEAVSAPSTIYSLLMVHLGGGFDFDPCCDLHGVVHITGGGIREKMTRFLRPSGFGALLNNLYEPSPVMAHCQLLAKLPDDEAYKTFCMGQGMAVVTPDPDIVLTAAPQFGIEAKCAGVITKEPGILIRSMGIEQREEFLPRFFD